MNYESYFPRGIASGAAFCNREQERAQIIKKVKSGQHLLIMSPRRYGKTSLVRKALLESKLPHAEIDLFVAVDAKRIEHQIINGVQDIIRQVTTSTEQAIEIVSKIFKSMRLKWVVGIKGLNISLTPDIDADPAENIKVSLEALEHILSKKKQRAVFFIDETQEIGEVAEGKGIEGAIRNVAQSSRYLSIVFSGSKRHLLKNMFLDDSRPLFKLCSRINLERIKKEEYTKHINKFANKTWKSPLTDNVFSEIFALTECHPYYLNALCLQVWELEHSKAPTDKEIKQCWVEMIVTDRQEILEEFNSLSLAQRKILIAISNGHNEQLTSQKFVTKIGLSSSTVLDSVNVLEIKDYVQKGPDRSYQIIDPLIKAAVKHYISD